MRLLESVQRCQLVAHPHRVQRMSEMDGKDTNLQPRTPANRPRSLPCVGCCGDPLRLSRCIPRHPPAPVRPVRNERRRDGLPRPVRVARQVQHVCARHAARQKVNRNVVLRRGRAVMAVVRRRHRVLHARAV